MRTEQQLRDAFTALADRPPAVDRASEQIMARTSPTSIRRRRTVFVLAAAIVVLVAIAVPAVLVNRTAVPADTRAPGNWNLIHRVDLPPGWGIRQSQVSADLERTSMQTPVGTDNPDERCELTVRGAGVFSPSSAPRTFAVNGQPAYYEAPTFDSAGGLFWPYAENSWANMSCTLGTDDAQDGSTRAESPALDLDLARRVVFAPTTVRLPFRLTEAPGDYTVQLIAQAPSPTTGPASSVQLLSPSAGRPPLGIVVTQGSTQIPERLPGWETDTVDGRPAVLSARDGRLCLNTQDHSVCVVAEGGEPAGPTSSWPAGRRELLVQVAEQLQLAPDLNDPSTWWDANRALPR